MLSAPRMYLLAALVAFSLVRQAWATDDVICTSKSFNASLAVGSDGYVVSMTLVDTSTNYFSEPLSITNLKKRQVSIPKRSVDIDATLEMKKAKRLLIWFVCGKGYIDIDSYREKITCDWEI